MSSSTRRFAVLLAVLPFIVVTTAGLYMVGMTWIEGEPRDFWSSLQWASETITTTGYGADHSWGQPAMVIFVALAQFLGVVLIYMIVPIYLIPYFEERFEARLPRQAPAKIQGHVVIFCFGAAVESVLEELRLEGVPAVVAEPDEALARRLVTRKLTVVHGPTPAAALAASRLGAARALIANSSDAQNAAVILIARQLGFAGEILALVEEPYHRKPMNLAGADAVYTPRHMLAAALAARASHRISPRVSGIQMLGRKVEVTEIRIDPRSDLVGRTLGEADIGAVTGTTILGQWVAGELVTQPTADLRLEPRGILIAAGQSENLQELAEMAGGVGFAQRQGPYLVGGFGVVGQKVRELLEAVGEEVRVVDLRQREGVGLVGDLLDHRILEQASPETAQAVVIALDSDASTLFATVVIRDRSPDVPIIARVNEAENVERIHRAGADFALSISQVSGQVLTRRLLRQETVSLDSQLRVMRVDASGLAGRHPAQLGIRRRTGCSVVAVERGDEVLVRFDPDFVFEPDDAVYICGSSSATHRFAEEFS